MMRYFLCPIIGDGSEEDSFRPAVAALKVSYATDIPHVRDPGPGDSGDGRPRFRRCLVFVNGTAAQVAACAALPGVTDPMPGLLSDEARLQQVLATLRATRFMELAMGTRTVLAAAHPLLAEANPATGFVHNVRKGLEDFTLEEWVDGLLQQQRRTAMMRNLFVRP